MSRCCRAATMTRGGSSWAHLRRAGPPADRGPIPPGRARPVRCQGAPGDPGALPAVGVQVPGSGLRQGAHRLGIQLPGAADRHPHPAQRELRLRVQRPGPAERLRHQVHVPLGAAHSAELQYVFGKVPLLDITPSFKPDQAALSAQMMGYWTRFAATGNPNAGPAPDGAGLGGSNAEVQELIPEATAPESEAVFAGFHQRAFWAMIEGQAAPR